MPFRAACCGGRRAQATRSGNEDSQYTKQQQQPRYRHLLGCLAGAATHHMLWLGGGRAQLLCHKEALAEHNARVHQHSPHDSNCRVTLNAVHTARHGTQAVRHAGRGTTMRDGGKANARQDARAVTIRAAYK